MEIKNRLFPYPVLCEENDDYTKSIFNIKCNRKEELHDIVFEFSVELTNEAMQWLLRDGIVECIVHIECSATSYRTTVKINGNQKSFRIPKNRVNQVITMVGMLVAKRPIKEFYSEDLNEDYQDEIISFDQASILAYKNLPKVHIYKNYEELKGDNAFFTIVKKMQSEQEESLPIEYDLNAPKIKILVDETTFDEYAKYRINPKLEALTSALLILPALAYMIDELRNADVESYKEYFWFQQIAKAYKLKGKNFIEDVLNADVSAIELAQDMLNMPIKRAFLSLGDVIEG
ncbi:MAG: hypothetical protein IJ435_04945 [Clostridia bacterium]|nr:hypothetical protein [Clostridia bacterium]